MTLLKKLFCTFVLQYHAGFIQFAFHMLLFLCYMQCLSFVVVSSCRRVCCALQDEFHGEEFDK